METPVRLVQVGHDPGPRPRLFSELTRIDDAANLVRFGHTDLVERAEPREAEFADEADARHLLVLALAPDSTLETRAGGPLPELVGDLAAPVIGFGWAELPLRDNLHVAEVYVVVDPPQRGHGTGRALALAIEHAVRQAGRTSLLAWADHAPGGEPGTVGTLAAPTGFGTVADDDPAVRLASALGYVLEQTERYSQLDLPVPAAVLDPLSVEAEERALGYRTLTWIGRTPEELVEPMAGLKRRMSTDAPSAGLDLVEEEWDAERVRRHDERTERLGKTRVMAAAQHRATGALVAYSTLILDPGHPEASWQGDTLVHGDHRGHRLGMSVKIANLRQLAEVAPDARRIHTWNAGENRWMLAINVALGFRPVGVEGAWQKRLPPPA